MKILIFFSMLFLSGFAVRAQQISIATGKSISFFDYKNSEGQKLKGLQSTSHTYMSLGYRRSIFSKSLFLHLNGNYKSYGATGSDRSFDNYFNWELNYLGFSAGLDYDFYKPGDFTFYLKGSAAIEFLIQGTQTINNQVFNLIGQKDFSSPFYFFRAGLGTQYKASERFSFFTQYMYGKGSMFKKPQGDLKIKEHQFGIGMLIGLFKKSPSPSEFNYSIPMYDSAIQQLKEKLNIHNQKIKELETYKQQAEDLKQQLADKEREIKFIKETIANALQPYQGNELTVKDKAGKVYITLGNDMLFKPGSTQLSPEGIDAINKLGEVLAEKNNLDILIEGHTDNQPFKNSAMNNWDLSVQRATAVVDILSKNKNIDSKHLTAAGRGATDPIVDNATEEGRKKNRRIEVIISPKLDKLSNLLNN